MGQEPLETIGEEVHLHDEKIPQGLLVKDVTIIGRSYLNPFTSYFHSFS